VSLALLFAELVSKTWGLVALALSLMQTSCSLRLGDPLLSVSRKELWPQLRLDPVKVRGAAGGTVAACGESVGPLKVQMLRPVAPPAARSIVKSGVTVRLSETATRARLRRP